MESKAIQEFGSFVDTEKDIKKKRALKFIAWLLILSFTSLQISWAQEYQTLATQFPQPEQSPSESTASQAFRSNEPILGSIDSIISPKRDSPLSPLTPEPIETNEEELDPDLYMEDTGFPSVSTGNLKDLIPPDVTPIPDSETLDSLSHLPRGDPIRQVIDPELLNSPPDDSLSQEPVELECGCGLLSLPKVQPVGDLVDETNALSGSAYIQLTMISEEIEKKEDVVKKKVSEKKGKKPHKNQPVGKKYEHYKIEGERRGVVYLMKRLK